MVHTLQHPQKQAYREETQTFSIFYDQTSYKLFSFVQRI